MMKGEERGEMAAAEEEEVEITMTTRARPTEMNKRKLHGEELSGCSSSLLQLKRHRRIAVQNENSDDLCSSSTSDHALSSPSSIALAEEKLVTKDLKEDDEASSVEIAISPTCNMNRRVRERETTPVNEVQAESAEIESTTVRSSEVHSKMPSDAELEEFFSAAEEKLQKQFADKYNFDIVNEEPLEGRYEWIRVKP